MCAHAFGNASYVWLLTADKIWQAIFFIFEFASFWDSRYRVNPALEVKQDLFAYYAYSDINEIRVDWKQNESESAEE